MRLKNKTALITGGNSGIGLATARVFVAEGAKVVITGRNRETLDAAARELGPNALALAADVTDNAAMEAAIRQGAEKFGNGAKSSTGTLRRSRLSWSMPKTENRCASLRFILMTGGCWRPATRR